MPRVTESDLRNFARRAARKIIAEQAGATSAFPLKVGSRGEEVKELQTALGLTADGIFGPQTRDAAKAKFGTDVVDQATFNTATGKAPPKPAGPGPEHVKVAKRIQRSIPSGDVDEKTGMPQRKGSPMFVISAVEDALMDDPTGKELDLIAHAYYQNTTGDNVDRMLLAAMMAAADKYGTTYPEAEDMRKVAEDAVDVLNPLGTGAHHMGAYDEFRDERKDAESKEKIAAVTEEGKEMAETLRILAQDLEEDAKSLEDDHNVIGIGPTDEDAIAKILQKYIDLSEKHGEIPDFPADGQSATPIELLAGAFDKEFSEDLQSHLEDEIAGTHPDVLMAFKKHYSKPPATGWDKSLSVVKRYGPAAIGGALGFMLGGPLGAAKGSAKAAAIGSAIGSVVPSALKGVGSAIGDAAGKVGSFVGGLFEGGDITHFDGTHFHVLHEGNTYLLTREDMLHERHNITTLID